MLQVARMIIIVALTFICLWSPFYVVNIVSQVQPISFLHRSNFLFTMLATHLAGFINSAINPIVYQAMSERFRRSFMDIVSGLLGIIFCGATNRYFSRRTPHFNGSRTWSVVGRDSTMITTYCNSNASPAIGTDTERRNSRFPMRTSYSALPVNNMHKDAVESAI